MDCFYKREMNSKHPPELRIVLIGKTGVGKNSAMNTLLGRPGLTPPSAASGTKECKMEKGVVDGQHLVVINTPGVFNTEKTKAQVEEDIVKCITYAGPGPHVFLYVLKPGPLTTEDEAAVKIIQKIFGEESKLYTLALFTHGDGGEIPDEEIQETFIGKLMRYHFFDNTGNGPTNQVSELLKKINKLVERNKGKNYTNEMFEKAQEVLKKQGVTPGNATQDALQKVVEIILHMTVGEELKDLVLGVVDKITKKVDKHV